jgi:hypothetical protein
VVSWRTSSRLALLPVERGFEAVGEMLCTQVLVGVVGGGGTTMRGAAGEFLFVVFIRRRFGYLPQSATCNLPQAALGLRLNRNRMPDRTSPCAAADGGVVLHGIRCRIFGGAARRPTAIVPA